MSLFDKHKIHLVTEEVYSYDLAHGLGLSGPTQQNYALYMYTALNGLSRTVDGKTLGELAEAALNAKVYLQAPHELTTFSAPILYHEPSSKAVALISEVSGRELIHFYSEYLKIKTARCNTD